MLPNTTKSTTNTVPFIKRREKRTRPTNHTRTPRKTRNYQGRLFGIPRSNSKDKSVKIALDVRKLNENCTKTRPHMSNLDEILDQNSAKLSRKDTDPIWIPVIDLDYAYGKMKLAPETSKYCNFAITGEKNKGTDIPLAKGILWTSRHTDHLPRENRQNTRPLNIKMVR